MHLSVSEERTSCLFVDWNIKEQNDQKKLIQWAIMRGWMGRDWFR